jgi:hypothetical protein
VLDGRTRSAVSSRPVTSQGDDARDAWWLRVALAAVWLITALTVLHPSYRAVGALYLARLGLSPGWMYAADAGELGLGLWLLRGPMGARLAAAQIAAIVGFTLALASVEPMLLVSPFGYLTKNAALCVLLLACVGLEREGLTPRVHRLLQVGAALPWWTEGLGPKVLFQQAVELELVGRLGLDLVPASRVLVAIGAAQALSGVAALTLRGRSLAWLLTAQAVALVALPLVVGALEPTLWVHPFGPFSKNVPVLAATLILRHRCISR